jgi:hypothetical protein
MYFGDVQALAKPYEQVADHIRSNNCHSIGIALAGHTAEYPFWVFLGSPSEDVVIEWIVDGSPSSKFRDQSFDACAIICDFSCPREWEVVNGLPLAYEVADYRLFMED